MGIIAKHHHDEEAARAFLERLFWPNGPVCPHCGVIGESTKMSREEGAETHGRTGLHQCNGCRKQFTITVGTIFADSKIPLHKWLLAFHLMCSSKKGMSALQLQRELELGSYRTAWFMAHRIRWAMTQTPMADAIKLQGVVEADETYVGGREKGKRGLPGPTSKKTPVLALVERGGRVRSFPIERCTLKNIKPVLQQHIDPSSHLVTDESAIYYMMKPHFAKHSTINHRREEYVRREENFTVTTNTIESFFALLKRSNYGIHHHVSRKYLGAYCAERDFVYNERKSNDDERTQKALRGAPGKRLMLREPKK